MNFIDDATLALMLKIDTHYTLFNYYNKIRLAISLAQLYIMMIVLCVGTILSSYFEDSRFSLYTALVLIFMYILLFTSRYIIDSKYKIAESKLKELEKRIDVLSGKEVKENEI